MREIFAAIIFCQFLSFAFTLNYELGKKYKYAYSTNLVVGELEPRKTKDVGLQISTEIAVNVVWQKGEEQLVKLEVGNVDIQGVAATNNKNQWKSLAKYPVYFQWISGQVGEVYTADKESISTVNIKKGIIALFQLRTGTAEQTEVDTSGECPVRYELDGTTLKRWKGKCRNLEIAGQYGNVNQILGTGVDFSLVTSYDLSGDIIQSASATESHVTSLNIRRDLGGSVKSSQSLKFIASEAGTKLQGSAVEDAVQSAGKGAGCVYLPNLLSTSQDLQQCTEDCTTVTELVAKYRDNALTKEHVAKTTAAEAFLELVDSFRNTGKDTVLQILKDSANTEILPQLIDIATAAQTAASQEALMEILNFDDDYYIDNPDRYLLAVSYSSHPSEKLIQDLLGLYKKKLPSEKLRESVGLALGAVVNTYARQIGKWEHEVVKSAQAAFTETLTACEDEACKLMQLRALGNARFPGLVGTLIKYAEESKEVSLSSAALKSLSKQDGQYITNEIKLALARIYNQNLRNFDTAVRTTALKILLNNQPSKSLLRDIILSAMDQSQFEMSTYVLAILRDAVKKDDQLRTMVEEILKDASINNINIMAQKGRSSAYTGFLAETVDTNCTYGLYMQNSNAGLMKSSIMDVQLNGKQQTLSLLSFGLYANALESMVSDDSGSTTESPEEAGEPTAGMSLDLMDVSLRTVEFFRGQGGLMSAVWNAPSELVSALQGNLLAQDFSQRVHLQNGFVADIKVQGCVSIDLSGLISISLWNRDSHSVVLNSGAMAVKGSVKVDNMFLKTGLQFNAQSSSQIDFTTDVNFYEKPFKMCLQMSHPDLTFRQTVNKYEKARGFKTNYFTKVGKTQNIGGQSFVLSPHNFSQCRILLANQ